MCFGAVPATAASVPPVRCFFAQAAEEQSPTAEAACTSSLRRFRAADLFIGDCELGLLLARPATVFERPVETEIEQQGAKKMERR